MNKNPSFSLLSYPGFDLKKFIVDSLKEDVGDGDQTSLACIPSNAKGSAKLLVKEKGILAGVTVTAEIFKSVDKNLKQNFFLKDGAKISPKDIVLEVSGSARSILTAERLVLNCMQRMSGIATSTALLMEQCRGTKAKVIDTRKTTPGFRALEKAAVKIGGGENHRYGLFDMILIKDNHIDYAGGIKQAITAANHYLKKEKKKLKIEVETRNIEEVKEVLSIGKVHRIMLDNYTPVQIKAAVKLINGKYETEASGGITSANIRKYAKAGVDFISVGALTHTVKSLDLSLKAVK